MIKFYSGWTAGFILLSLILIAQCHSRSEKHIRYICKDGREFTVSLSENGDKANLVYEDGKVVCRAGKTASR
ncbi:hypothetical protein KJ762_06925 [bacterium]|nr:hypothetical protein [bacterium]MBU1634226.1 hypothetical protein [bacterium]MBU1872587.1 hypothetical protein [bacterium]